MCLSECAVGFCNLFRPFGSISIGRYCTARTETQKKTYNETITDSKIPTSSITRVHGVPPTRSGLRIGVRVGTIVNRIGKRERGT